MAPDLQPAGMIAGQIDEMHADHETGGNKAHTDHGPGNHARAQVKVHSPVTVKAIGSQQQAQSERDEPIFYLSGHDCSYRHLSDELQDIRMSTGLC